MEYYLLAVQFAELSWLYHVCVHFKVHLGSISSYDQVYLFRIEEEQFLVQFHGSSVYSSNVIVVQHLKPAQFLTLIGIIGLMLYTR